MAGQFALGSMAGLFVLVSSSALFAQTRVPSRPETVVWGEIPIDRPAVATLKSGARVIVDTLSHQGSTQDADPVTYLAGFGVRREDVLQDAIDFWKSRASRPREGRGPHILTGPIYVEDAEPGDMLEIRVVDLTLRTPFGMNSSGPATGVLGSNYPGTRPDDAPPVGAPRVITTGRENGRAVGLVSKEIVVPLRPFMGIMAVAPVRPRMSEPGITVDGVQTTRPPGPFGGNLDYKDLTVGATLYLPVFHKGAQFYVGDPHSAQGDGEVNGTAIEHSLTGTFQFVLHKRRAITAPRAENATHYIVMGIDLDLNRAMRLATQHAVDFLVHEKGLTPADAYTVASVACDFHVAEAVDLTQVVVGKIPKEIFRR